MAGKRIAILFQEGLDGPAAQRYVITLLAEVWREDGHEVLLISGPSRYVPADIAIVHVDLSVVPEPYFDLARRYPIAVNGQVRDIRKSTFSEQVVRAGDPWDGRVIVKSDLNFAGVPERRLAAARERGIVARARRWVARTLHPPFDDSSDYAIYDSPRRVPRRYLRSRDFIVEKFLPEMDGDSYCLRSVYFLGDRIACVRIKSRSPIVKGETCAAIERVEPHPEMLAVRARMRLDYGKLDYVVVDGKPILLDVNKTVGASPGTMTSSPEMKTLRRFRAEGLYSYFESAMASSPAPG
jgi:hypothetical protein